jgi:hypothetical protein
LPGPRPDVVLRQPPPDLLQLYVGVGERQRRHARIGNERLRRPRHAVPLQRVRPGPVPLGVLPADALPDGHLAVGVGAAADLAAPVRVHQPGEHPAVLGDLDDADGRRVGHDRDAAVGQVRQRLFSGRTAAGCGPREAVLVTVLGDALRFRHRPVLVGEVVHVTRVAAERREDVLLAAARPRLSPPAPRRRRRRLRTGQPRRYRQRVVGEDARHVLVEDVLVVVVVELQLLPHGGLEVARAQLVVGDPRGLALKNRRLSSPPLQTSSSSPLSASGGAAPGSPAPSSAPRASG